MQLEKSWTIMTIRIIDDATILFTPEKFLTIDPLTL